MSEIITKFNDHGKGGFYFMEDGQQLGEMEATRGGDKLSVYHTGVKPEAEGTGVAKQLLQQMVTYAREQQLKVVPLCPYVHAQFKRHADLYADIWFHGDVNLDN